MMTDGVMDALPVECEEETMKEIIMDIQDETPREIRPGDFGTGTRVQRLSCEDDMTVLVANVVRK